MRLPLTVQSDDDGWTIITDADNRRIISDSECDVAAVQELVHMANAYPALKILYEQCQDLRVRMREMALARGSHHMSVAQHLADEQWRSVRALLGQMALDEREL